MDNYLVVLQSAFKILSNDPKYTWLNEFTGKFSDKFSINFLDALQFVQYMNGLSHNWSLKLQKKAWKSVLGCIISDLNYQQHNKQPREDNLAIDDNTYKNIEQPPVQPNTETNSGNLNNNTPPKIETNYETSNINLLSKNLSFDKLNWVNYEDVLHMVNAIKHDWLRNEVMGCLVNNDVIWAQRLLWMDINCDPNKYPDFVASKKLWRRELRLMEEHWEYMTLKDPQEVLNYFQSLAEYYELNEYEPCKIYKKFLSWEWRFNNHWLPYCIISKYDYKLYLFSADHKLIFETPVLTWADSWNEPNNMDPKKWKIMRTTPWGFYKIWWTYDKTSTWKNLFSLYWSDFLITIPCDWQYLLEIDWNGNYLFVLWIHWEWNLRGYKVVDLGNWKTKLVEVPRSELYETNDSQSHNTSLWCTNVSKKVIWILINYLPKGSTVYYCFDDEIIDAKHLWYKFEDGIETIEHFWNEPKNVMQFETAELLYTADKRHNHIRSNKLLAHNNSLDKDGPNNSEQHNMKRIIDSKSANLAYTLTNNKWKNHRRNFA